MAELSATDRALLAAYDSQARQVLTEPQPGWTVEVVGPLIRMTAEAGSDSSTIEWSGLDARTVDAAIAGEVAHFARRGQSFEWKVYGHDEPSDLAERLRAAGFEPEEREALVIGETATVLTTSTVSAPDPTLTLREATEADLAPMGELVDDVWARDPADTTARLRELWSEYVADPAALRIFVVLGGGRVVSHGWVRLPADSDFASLWGGSTHPAWRGRGIYRALVACRAQLAAQTGHRYLQVDASPDSRPILERLGLRVLDWTQPYRWSPPAKDMASRP